MMLYVTLYVKGYCEKMNLHNSHVDAYDVAVVFL